MSLATRCPSCGTIFRVVQDQLKVSEGWVRCGQCHEVFHGIEALFDLDSDPAIAARRAAARGIPAAPPPARVFGESRASDAPTGDAASRAPASPPLQQPARPAIRQDVAATPSAFGHGDGPRAVPAAPAPISGFASASGPASRPSAFTPAQALPPAPVPTPAAAPVVAPAQASIQPRGTIAPRFAARLAEESARAQANPPPSPLPSPYPEVTSTPSAFGSKLAQRLDPDWSAPTGPTPLTAPAPVSGLATTGSPPPHPSTSAPADASVQAPLFAPAPTPAQAVAQSPAYAPLPAQAPFMAPPPASTFDRSPAEAPATALFGGTPVSPTPFVATPPVTLPPGTAPAFPTTPAFTSRPAPFIATPPYAPMPTPAHSPLPVPTFRPVPSFVPRPVPAPFVATPSKAPATSPAFALSAAAVEAAEAAAPADSPTPTSRPAPPPTERVPAPIPRVVQPAPPVASTDGSTLPRVLVDADEDEDDDERAGPPTLASMLPEDAGEWPPRPRSRSRSTRSTSTALAVVSRNDPRFLREATSGARWRRPWVRAALSVALLLLIVAAAGQFAWPQRDILAARWPATLPAWEWLCEQSDCKIEPPRAIAGLALDGSSLTRTETEHVLLFSADLHNRADHAVRMPWFDLTFMDLNGEIVARKVLSPEQIGIHQGALAPDAELHVHARLQVGSTDASGFQADLFYP
jgi:predicted Zn finger-like uncharacterized protein